MELGEDAPGEVDTMLAEKIKEAEKNGMSSEDVTKLTVLLN